MKIIPFYLPQFHRIPENDEWWGKGFTEWVNVKKAKPLFKGHKQPQIPLNNHYYDLSQVETIRWQASLANKYGIYGMCFYHYWFNGKMLLEKPAELLLKHKDINLRFCFSWANEPWARTWDGKNSEVLMPQSYGEKESWKNHFDYLLPFFKDERYIHENGKPMFLLYKSSSIPKCKEMMEYWIELARENDLKGIHFVETLRGSEIDKRDLPFEAKVEFEPGRIFNSISYFELTYNRIRRYTFKYISKCFKSIKVYNKVLKFSDVAAKSLKKVSSKGTYAGGFLGWDNSPRKGSMSTIVTKPTAKEVRQYLTTKIEIAHAVYKTDYLFLNAWNEWCEGTYLEPDTEHKYEYLKVVKSMSNK